MKRSNFLWRAFAKVAGTAAVGLIACAPMIPVPAKATVIAEAPWAPAAAAYRTSLFLGNLSPVPWEKIADAWSGPILGTGDNPTAPIEAIRTVLGDAAADAVIESIGVQDRHALFSGVTLAVGQSLLAHLEAAENASSGESGPHIARARNLYRAFEDGIKAADPLAARAIGLAWLELNSAAGSKGVGGAGATARDTERFTAAKAKIAAYIAANFAPKSFTERRTLAPVPEMIARSGADVSVPPTLPPGTNIADQDPLPRLALRFEEQGIDEADLPLVAYGDMLFDSPQIFGEPARSLGVACSTCHNRSDINQDFFIPGASHRAGGVDVDGGFFNPLFNDRRDDPLDIPSLRGLRLTGPYGRDGRFGSLRDFTRNVIVNEFRGPEPTPFMLDALLAYMEEFDWLANAKVDVQGRLTDAASPAAHRGAELFRKPFEQFDGKSCASCHVPSGNFLDHKRHNIGTGGTESALDGTFETPSLLNSRFTAPYMHDGSLPTLASVVAWFDDAHALGLSKAERSDLTAYLEAIGDADEPFEQFDARNTPFRLAFEELTTFASTLDTLLPMRDRKHALLLIDTVAPDLAADSSVMANLSARSEVFALSRTLSAVGTAIRAEDWAKAEQEWDAFKTLQADADARMF